MATAPTDQRAGVKPIAFVLDNNGTLSQPLTLQIRPEDLSRADPARATVHQTLGRGVQGWVDNFGAGLPTITISGHTGWRTSAGTGADGIAGFTALGRLLTVTYHEAKQAAINAGMDPAGVRLLFCDMLDGFTLSVSPQQFSLKRNKSSPLLMRYNIVMQAVSLNVEEIRIEQPDLGSVGNGLLALDRTMTALASYAPATGPGPLDGLLDGIFGDFGGVISGFIRGVNGAIGAVIGFVDSAKALATSTANKLIGFASDLAGVGLNLFRALNSIRDLPTGLQAEVNRVASAFNELVCIFANSLAPRPVYETYNGLYGASNCSSTVGGRPPSPYANLNVFSLIMDGGSGNLSVSSEAMASIAAVRAMDPVLAPMPAVELERHMGIITAELSA